MSAFNYETNGKKASNIITTLFTGFDNYDFNLIPSLCRIPPRKSGLFAEIYKRKISEL